MYNSNLAAHFDSYFWYKCIYKKENYILVLRNGVMMGKVEVEVGVFFAPWCFSVPFQSISPLSLHDLPDSASSCLPNLDYIELGVSIL